MQTTEPIISLYLRLELLQSTLKIISFFICVSSQPCCFMTLLLYSTNTLLCAGKEPPRTWHSLLGYTWRQGVECGFFFQQQGIFLSTFKRRRERENNCPKSIMEYFWFMHSSFWTVSPWLAEKRSKRRGQGVVFQCVCLSCGPSCYEKPLKQLQQESSFCSLPHPPLFLGPPPPPRFLSCGSRPGKWQASWLIDTESLLM